MNKLLVLISMFVASFSSAQAGNFKFACQDVVVPPAIPKLIIAGIATPKHLHYQLSAKGQISGRASVQYFDSNEDANSYGAVFVDEANQNVVRIGFDVEIVNNAYHFNNDGFTLGHPVLPADGKITAVATVSKLDGQVPGPEFANFNVSCYGSAEETSGDGFRNFFGNLARGVGEGIVCAATSQGCEP